MGELSAIRLRTLVWLILPVLVVVAVPRWLYDRFEQPAAWRWGIWPWIGAWLIANGLGLAAWCVNLFNVEGRGTPLPLDPPKRFVARGPYRFVRNPMVLGMGLILGGETIFYQSRVLAVYWLLIAAAAHLVICCWEEPYLARRFGPSYDAYRRQVPRWIPRFPRRFSGAQPSKTQ